MANEIHLQGAAEINRIMKAFGPDVSKKAGIVGVRRGAVIMRRALAKASPKVSGTLRKTWRYKKLRSRRNSKYVAYVINLRDRHYYETLEFGNKRVSKPTHPFAQRAADDAKLQVLATIMAGTKTALTVEAGKAFVRSKRLGR